MATRKVKLTFLQQLITLPIIYELGKEFNLVTNIRRVGVFQETRLQCQHG